MSELTLNPQELDALYQLIVKKIPSIKEPSRLKELVKQTVGLILRQPGDESLRGKLIQCVNDMFVGRVLEPPSTVQKARAARTARDCVEVLQAAKERRLPRDIDYPQGAKEDNVAAKAPRAVPTEKNFALKLLVAASVFAAILVGSIVWQSSRSDRNSIFLDAKTLTDQMIAAAKPGSDDAASTFGGQIKRKTVEGRITVVADKVPNRICAASGWQLVHKGVLTVNGVTPKRVSSAIITDLCYSAKDEATMVWEPKETQ